jgi:hypothetical protein
MPSIKGVITKGIAGGVALVAIAIGLVGKLQYVQSCS